MDDKGVFSDGEQAQMQSAVDKERNFEETAQEIVARMQTDPASITSEVYLVIHVGRRQHLTYSQDANHLKSREARAMGQAQPPSDSVSADAQRVAAANEGATKSTTDPKANMAPSTQSTVDRKENFEDVAVNIGHKMKSDPRSVTKEEADLLHSREQRAFGQTEKGGVAAQAQHLATENEKKAS